MEYFNTETLTGEYLENGEICSMEFHPEPEDIIYLRTFKTEDLTFRGTVEFRSACCQPISDVMTVAAFHIGLLDKTDELMELIKNDRSLYNNGYNAVELRRRLVCRVKPAFIDIDGLYALAEQILDLCRQGLIERGYGEEIYLSPLYERVEKRTNPAQTMLTELESGIHIDKIIKEYGR